MAAGLGFGPARPEYGEPGADASGHGGRIGHGADTDVVALSDLLAEALTTLEASG
jgi:hypothetical protein